MENVGLVLCGPIILGFFEDVLFVNLVLYLLFLRAIQSGADNFDVFEEGIMELYTFLEKPLPSDYSGELKANGIVRWQLYRWLCREIGTLALPMTPVPRNLVDLYFHRSTIAPLFHGHCRQSLASLSHPESGRLYS
jgi:hypothetical protein